VLGAAGSEWAKGMEKISSQPASGARCAWGHSDGIESALMGFEPVLADADFDLDGDIEVDGGFHVLLDKRPHLLLLGCLEAEDEFVVNLQ